MEQISKALQQLADKLGTTVTYLWHVLVKQAVVNGIGNLIIYIIVTIWFIILYKLHIKFSKNYGNGESIYEQTEAISIVPMVLLSLAWIICFIICLFSITDTVNSFGNPEYWALHEILNKI